MAVSLDQEYATYKGQSVLVPGEPDSERGQCVQWADYVLHDVYGLPYHYGNAIDWWNNPKELLTENFVKIGDGSIKKGDFVVFNELVGSVYGHIDVAMADGNVTNFTGSDTNWGGNLTVHEVNHVNKSYVLGSLRIKEQDMPTLATLYDCRRLDFYMAGRNGLDGQPNSLAGENDADLNANHVGKPLDQTVQAFADSNEGHAWIGRYTDWANSQGNAPTTLTGDGVTYTKS